MAVSTRRYVALVVLVSVSGARTSAQACGELRIWTARALATVLSEVGSTFENASGCRLVVTSDLPAGFARRAAAGEGFDVLISMSPTVDAWIRDGKVSADSRSDIARSGIGVEVRAGALKPDISTVDAFKRALLEAKSIAYLRVGSGIHVDGIVARLGIADAIKLKVTRPETDIVSELVAKGDVELGIVVITQILTTPGVQLVGPLPNELQLYLTFTAAVSAASQAKAAAAQLIQFLKGPVATPVINSQGMEPVRP